MNGGAWYVSKSKIADSRCHILFFLLELTLLKNISLRVIATFFFLLLHYSTKFSNKKCISIVLICSHSKTSILERLGYALNIKSCDPPHIKSGAQNRSNKLVKNGTQQMPYFVIFITTYVIKGYIIYHIFLSVVTLLYKI